MYNEHLPIRPCSNSKKCTFFLRKSPCPPKASVGFWFTTWHVFLISMVNCYLLFVHINKYIRMRFSLICLLGVAIWSLARASSEEHLSEIMSRLEKLENENKIKDEKITYLLEKTKYCPQGGIEGQTQISPRKWKFTSFPVCPEAHWRWSETMSRPCKAICSCM